MDANNLAVGWVEVELKVGRRDVYFAVNLPVFANIHIIQMDFLKYKRKDSSNEA